MGGLVEGNGLRTKGIAVMEMVQRRERESVSELIWPVEEASGG